MAELTYAVNILLLRGNGLTWRTLCNTLVILPEHPGPAGEAVCFSRPQALVAGPVALPALSTQVGVEHVRGTLFHALAVQQVPGKGTGQAGGAVRGTGVTVTFATLAGVVLG